MAYDFDAVTEEEAPAEAVPASTPALLPTRKPATTATTAPTTSSGLPSLKSGGGLDDVARSFAEYDAGTKKFIADQEAGIDDRLQRKQGVIEDIRKTRPKAPDLALPPPPPEQKEETNAMQAFGSAASVLGILGGFLTRRPLTTALKASAGAMNAIRAKDQQGFENAIREWKVNVDYVREVNDVQQSRYDAALKAHEGDATMQLAALQAEAAAMQDKFALQELKKGNLQSVVQLFQMKRQAAKDFADNADKLALRVAEIDLRKAHAEYYRAGGAQQNTVVGELNRRVRQINEQRAAEGKPAMNSEEINAEWMKINPAMFAARERSEDKDLDRESREKRDAARLSSREKIAGDALAVKKELGERALDQGDQRITQTKWYQDQDIELKKQGKSIEERKLEMTERIAKMKLYGQTDQGIINELRYYPEMKREDLGKINQDNQKKMISAFQVRGLLEKAAEYATVNPESVGLVADASRKVNLDTFQGLVQNPDAWFRAVGQATEAMVDKLAAERKLAPTAASKAKILNKDLATLAFTDAATFGRGGGTVYLDRAFREIYQQSSNLPTFLEILRRRYEDSDRFLQRYDMGLDKRADKDKQPFWQSGTQGYAEVASVVETARKAGRMPPKIVRTPEEFKDVPAGTDYFEVGEDGVVRKFTK
jgi:hypothetical protein